MLFLDLMKNDFMNVIFLLYKYVIEIILTVKFHFIFYQYLHLPFRGSPNMQRGFLLLLLFIHLNTRKKKCLIHFKVDYYIIENGGSVIGTYFAK